MSKTIIGLIFMLAGVAYGSLALDSIYNRTIGLLLKYGLIKAPPPSEIPKSILGPKGQILLYAAILIIIGLYLLWNRNT